MQVLSTSRRKTPFPKMLRCASQHIQRRQSSTTTRMRLMGSKAGPYKLVLIRHGESDWNRKNVFTGWVDCDLSEKGVAEAREGGQLMKQAGLTFDKAYTSVLRRAIRTCWLVLEEMDLMWLPTVKAWQLNERHYGALQGLNKAETVAKHGPEKVQVWRRSYDIPPPPVDESSEHYPGNDPRYKGLSKNQLPKTESLKTTLERVIPYWEEHLTKEILAGQNLLVAAHGNSLRALVKQLDGVSDEAISELNIPTGTPLVYELDDRLKPIPHPQAIAPLSGYYLGDQDAIRRRIEGVKAQTGGVKP